jgi:DNA-binding transcriptional LysR family regulator
MLPDLDSLRCFVAAAQALNFRQAARSVNLTPAALGQRIKLLEGALDTQLFARTTRSVQLTPEGLALLPYAQRALDAARDCARAARGELAVPLEVVLGTRHELGLSWLLPQLDALSQRHPAVTFHLYVSSGEDLLLRLRTREIDCAVTSTRYSDGRLDAVRLHREEYAFVGASALLGTVAFETPEDARRHTLLDAGPELPLFRYWVDAPGGGERLHFGRVLRMGTIAAIERMVLDGRGVAVLPRYLVREALGDGRLRELFPEVVCTSDWFRLVFRARDPRQGLFESIARALLEAPLR